MAEESGVVPRAGTEFEYAVAGFDFELFEHHADDGRLRGAADGDAALVVLGVHRRVLVRLLQGGVGDEGVARHASHGFFHAGGVYFAVLDELVDELGTEVVGGRGVDGVGVHGAGVSGRRDAGGGGRGAVARSHDYFFRAG